METEIIQSADVKPPFTQRFFRLVAILGVVLSGWYLLTQPIANIEYSPVMILGISVALLIVLATQLNYLSHVAVLGGAMLYAPQTVVVAVLLGVLLALFYKRGNLRPVGWLRGYFVEVGLLLIPMSLAIESMNWESDVLFNYAGGGRMFQSGGTFLLFFVAGHAIFKLGDLLWQGTEPNELSFKEVVGWVWSELAPAALVYLAIWHFAFSEASALVLLGFFPLAISLLMYLLTRNAMKEIPQFGENDSP